MTGAQKAAATRKARRAFFDAYPDTAEVARDYMKGVDDEDIMYTYCIAKTELAAVKANLHRYSVYAEIAEACNS